jgi:hypothetical protein
MQGFSVESKTSGISSSSTLWQNLEARTSHATKQTWLQEARDSTREDDKLRGPNQKKCRILWDKELRPTRRETDDKGLHAEGGSI